MSKRNIDFTKPLFVLWHDEYQNSLGSVIAGPLDWGFERARLDRKLADYKASNPTIGFSVIEASEELRNIIGQ